MMLTDVEIAQSAKMKPIKEIAEKVGLDKMIWSFMVSIKLRFH